MAAVAAVVVVTLAVVPAWGQTILSSGHADIGIAYEGGAWDLHVHVEDPEPGQEFEPDEVILQVGGAAALAGGVPDNAAATAFFGAAGSPLWILSKTEHPDLLFLGFGTEELDADDWVGSLSLELRGVSGPGEFFVWDVGGLGDLQPLMSTRDGISAGDALPLIAGSHAHFFVGFSAPGDYEIDFAARGVHAVDGALVSDPVTYPFSVVPEPGVGALLALGALGLMAFRRRSVV
jgi:surface-anchored protein